MKTPAAILVEALTTHGRSVATAESLTGGRLATRFTDIPGSSSVFLGGVVSYATDVKIDVLGVPREVVEKHGVVSAECARAMADGVRRLLGSTYAVSTTGVAGPDRQEGKPVGTVHVGIAGPAGTETLLLRLDGDRTEIQEQTVDRAVAAVQDALDATPRGHLREEPDLG